MSDYLRLAFGGLLLNGEVYREQREASNGFQRGFVLVLIIGLLSGLTAAIGQVGEALLSPDPRIVAETIYNGLITMPWYERVVELEPDFRQNFEEAYQQVLTSLDLFAGGGVLRGLSALITVPLGILLRWLIFGALLHLVARLFGGNGNLSQTLACMALASSAELLALVQIVPFAQVAATTLLGLIASYIAIREAHRLEPMSAFWATLTMPIIFGLLFLCGFCFFLFGLSNTIGNL